MADTEEFRDFEHRGWDKAAAHYGQGFGELTQQSVEPLLDAVQAGRGLRLLDVACGPGYVAAAAAARGSSVLGIDFSAEMVAIAATQNPTVQFQEGDAENLNLAESTFDVVVMNYGMLHLAQPDRAISEALRVLRPGGRYAFTVWDLPERAVGFQIVLEAISNCGDMNVPLPSGPPFFRFSDPVECSRALTAAGFAETKVARVPQWWRLNSGEEMFWTMRRAAVRTAALLNMQNPDALARIEAEISARAETFRNGNVIEIPMPAILASTARPS
jgi:SAM-dependent methyltransferase